MECTVWKGGMERHLWGGRGIFTPCNALDRRRWSFFSSLHSFIMFSPESSAYRPFSPPRPTSPQVSSRSNTRNAHRHTLEFIYFPSHQSLALAHKDTTTPAFYYFHHHSEGKGIRRGGPRDLYGFVSSKSASNKTYPSLAALY